MLLFRRCCATLRAEGATRDPTGGLAGYWLDRAPKSKTLRRKLGELATTQRGRRCSRR